MLAAIGGGTVVLVGVLTIFKGLLVKLFETGIESSFEKKRKLKNKLKQSTKANTLFRYNDFAYLALKKKVPISMPQKSVLK